MKDIETAVASPRGQERERRIVLASRSPRRRYLMEQAGFCPVVWPARVDEVWHPSESPEQYTRRLAETKARVVADEARSWLRSGISPWVVAADTVVVLDGNLLEKPDDDEDARRKLELIRGRWHTVFTAFSVHSVGEPARVRTRVVQAEVLIKQLSSGEIERYIASRDPMDKAGAYGIQGLGSFLVREVRGSYFTVVGLPVCEVVEVLMDLGAVSGFPFWPGRSPHSSIEETT